MPLADAPSTADVFDELKRFHVYDHANDRWVMSGVDFGDCVALQHAYDEDGQQARIFSSIDTVTEDDEDLTVVYEDDRGGEYDEVAIDMEVAGEAANVVTDAVASLEDVDPERVRVATLSAPNVVQYFLAPEGVDGE